MLPEQSGPPGAWKGLSPRRLVSLIPLHCLNVFYCLYPRREEQLLILGWQTSSTYNAIVPGELRTDS